MSINFPQIYQFDLGATLGFIGAFEKTDLIIYDVNTEETTTNIVLKQRENPRAYCDNNIFCAVVSKSLIKDVVDVKIQH